MKEIKTSALDPVVSLRVRQLIRVLLDPVLILRLHVLVVAFCTVVYRLQKGRLILLQHVGSGAAAAQ